MSCRVGCVCSESKIIIKKYALHAHRPSSQFISNQLSKIYLQNSFHWCFSFQVNAFARNEFRGIRNFFNTGNRKELRMLFKKKLSIMMPAFIKDILSSAL